MNTFFVSKVHNIVTSGDSDRSPRNFVFFVEQALLFYFFHSITSAAESSILLLFMADILSSAEPKSHSILEI